MSLVKRIVCDHCSGEFEIETTEDYPLLFCPHCASELDEVEIEDDEADD